MNGFTQQTDEAVHGLLSEKAVDFYPSVHDLSIYFIYLFIFGVKMADVHLHI